MHNINLKNNLVNITGKVSSELSLSHNSFDENFYTFFVDVPRLSESSDKIHVTISEKLIDIESLKMGTMLTIAGQFRSYNYYTEQKTKLMLTVFVHDIQLMDENYTTEVPNEIFLNGFICKQPNYRVTPLGREITDLLVAVNRGYKKSDYIPCIVWGRNAKFSQNLKVGDNVEINGRIQSREYQKKLESGDIVNNTAFEISVSKINLHKKDAEEQQNEQEEQIEENQA